MTVGEGIDSHLYIYTRFHSEAVNRDLRMVRSEDKVGNLCDWDCCIVVHAL